MMLSITAAERPVSLLVSTVRPRIACHEGTLYPTYRSFPMVHHT